MLILTNVLKIQVLDSLIKVIFLLVALSILVVSSDAKEVDGIKLTPLMDAIHEKDMVKVTKLLDNEVDPNEKVGRGVTALFLAVATSNVEAVKTLLERGAIQEKINGTTSPLTAAVSLKDNIISTQIVFLLISHGLPSDHIKEDGIMPDLMTAIFHKNTTLVKLLIDKGASVNVSDEGGGKPIDAAVLSGQLDMVRLLLDADAKTNNENLLLAYSLGNPQILELVIDSGISPSSYVPIGEYKESIMKVAFNVNKPDTIKVLIENGIDVNVVTQKGVSPLVFAAQNGNVDLVRFLLARGANINLKDNRENTALLYAEKGDYTEIVKMLNLAAKGVLPEGDEQISPNGRPAY